MAEEQKTQLRLEIAHVLFMDIVGYSKLRIDERLQCSPRPPEIQFSMFLSGRALV